MTDNIFDGWSDRELRSYSLKLWANYVETGNISLSAKELVERSKYERTMGGQLKFLKQIKALTDEQVAFVARLRKLANEEYIEG